MKQSILQELEVMGSERSNEAEQLEDRLIRAELIEKAATDLFVAVWPKILDGTIGDRTRVDDAMLRLRDALNPDALSNPDRLPQELQSEQ